MAEIGVILKAASLSCLMLGLDDLTRDPKKVGLLGHLSPSLCGLPMQTLQHGLLICGLRAPKVHAPRERTPGKRYFVF